MKRIASLVLLLGVGACLSPSFPPPMDANKTADLPKPSRSLTPEQLKQLDVEIGDYRLGSSDVVEFYCMSVPELNRRYALGPDGKLTLPGIGVVSLNGLTREASERKIEALLTNYRDPHVNLMIVEYNNNRVAVLGEVQWPGLYNFPGRTLLLDALARAKGLTDKADMHGCTIVRGNGMLIEIDLYDLLRKGDRTLNIPLLPDDAVFVRANDEHTVYVMGEVNKPGIYNLGQDEDVVQALAAAGDVNHDAAGERIQIVRRDRNGQAIVLTVNLEAIQDGWTSRTDNPLLVTGDIVYVPRKGIATFNYYLNQLTPSVNTILLGATMQNALKSKP